MQRSLYLYIPLIVITMSAGLLSRSELIYLPSFIKEYSGDTLWAMLVFWLFRSLLANASSFRVAVWAISFSFLIEFSQLYQADWINAIRHTTLGALVLGFGFKLSDLLCYSVGVFLAYTIETRLLANKLKMIKG